MMDVLLWTIVLFIPIGFAVAFMLDVFVMLVDTYRFLREHKARKRLYQLLRRHGFKGDEE